MQHQKALTSLDDLSEYLLCRKEASPVSNFWIGTFTATTEGKIYSQLTWHQQCQGKFKDIIFLIHLFKVYAMSTKVAIFSSSFCHVLLPYQEKFALA